MVESKEVFVPAPNVAYRTIGGQTVIVDQYDNRMLTLNATGTEVWNRLDGRTVEQIARSLSERFEVDRKKALADVKAFIERMLAEGLVAVAEGGADGR